MLCGQSLIPFHFITSDPLIQETVTDSSRNCRFFTRCTGQNFSNQLILFFCCPYFVLIFMSKCFWTTSIFCTNPNPNCIMKSFFIYSLWCFWPFSLAVQFHTLFLVFITIFHKNTPNTGCPVLGVHITANCCTFFYNVFFLYTSKSSCLYLYRLWRLDIMAMIVPIEKLIITLCCKINNHWCEVYCCQCDYNACKV